MPRQQIFLAAKNHSITPVVITPKNVSNVTLSISITNLLY